MIRESAATGQTGAHGTSRRRRVKPEATGPPNPRAIFSTPSRQAKPLRIDPFLVSPFLNQPSSIRSGIFPNDVANEFFDGERKPPLFPWAKFRRPRAASQLPPHILATMSRA